MNYLKRYAGPLVVSATLLASVGCGDATPEAVTQQDPSVKSKDELKQRLQGIAQSGNAGSALAGMRPEIEKLGDKALLAELDQLEKTQDPEAIKQIAARMAGKL